MEGIGIKHLRTGFSWADFHTKEGHDWYDWLLPKLSAHFDVMPCFLYTPPSYGLEHKTSSPPRGAKMYADFLDVVIRRYGEHFEYVELWNEPNNRSEYDYTLDYNWEIFSEMIVCAAHWCKKLGKKTVLGGMSPVDPNWLDFMAQKGVLNDIDVVGIHGFPGTFDPLMDDWENVVKQVTAVLNDHKLDIEVWITEAGYSTWKHDEIRQVEEFGKIVKAPVSRAYWYSLYDLAPEMPTVDGFHHDDREYFFGLIGNNGKPKLLFRLLQSFGVSGILGIQWLFKKTATRKKQKGGATKILITGGAGFVGTNLANRFLDEGEEVIIYDNLSRPGVEQNLQWLLERHGNKVQVEIADVRNGFKLMEVVQQAKAVFHFAAQVAVTTSLVDPEEDFSINARGTFNLLEAIRKSGHQPPVIFTSTNKVYGSLEQVYIEEKNTRYEPIEDRIRLNGINENTNLDFHSPYGSSKGAAEQYIIDYGRSFGLKTLVFRMSCIYGEHQFGTEDQGWVAHFLLSAMKGKPLMIYGNGKQVRDILYVQDLVNAFQLGLQNIDRISGRAFNIGGGPKNSVSLIELIELIESIHDCQIEYEHAEVRTGDQPYYVSDTTEFERLTGWRRKTSCRKGIEQLYDWLLENRTDMQKAKAPKSKQTQTQILIKVS